MMQVDVLLVTYGNRWPLLRMTMQALAAMPEIRKVTLVDNGSRYDVLEQLKTIQTPDVELIIVPENKGSAFAFGAGIKRIQEDKEARFILLLDDDLIPQENCISRLLQQASAIYQEKGNYQFLLQCMRPDRSYLRSAAKGVDTGLFFPQPDHFLGFNIFSVFHRGAKKRRIKKIAQLPDAERATIPCAPYGGLCIPVEAIAQLGEPDVRFNTYADDFAFTLRYSQSGGTIYLIPQAIAEDQEATLVNKRRGGLFSSKFFDMPERRLFLLMRNTAWYTGTMLSKRKWLFHLNRIIYTAYLFVSALLHGKLRSFKIYNFAVRQGIRGIFREEDVPKQKSIITPWGSVPST